MLLVIHGSEPYLVHRKLTQAMEKARTQSAAGISQLPADTSDIGAAREALRGGSLFGDRSVVVLQDWFREKSAEEANELAELLGTVPEDTVVIVAEAGAVDRRRKAFAGLVKRADKAWRFDTMDEATAARWLVKRAAAHDAELSPGTARRIVATLGTDGWTLATELDKLTAAAGTSGTVTDTLVNDLVSRSGTATIWELVDGVAARDFPKAQAALKGLLDSGEPAIRVFAMVVRQYRILLGVQAAAAEGGSDAAIGKQLGVHPYSVKQARRQADRFSEAELKEIFAELVEQDLATKRGKRDAAEALELFVAERTQPAVKA
ncbi:MAG: DNA polymerase III subunit delta [bacterium]|nr:DNA polymerase III subunit delta [bacterium]